MLLYQTPLGFVTPRGSDWGQVDDVYVDNQVDRVDSTAIPQQTTTYALRKLSEERRYRYAS